MFTPLQQIAFENSVTKGEIADYEQFLPLPKRFKLFLINYYFHILFIMLSKLSVAVFYVYEKWLKR